MEQIFDMWPSMADFARDMGEKYPTVAAWKQRRNIPAHRDFDVVAAANRRGLALTIEELARARRDAHEQKAGA